MSTEVRARMVEGAAALLARRGVQATSFGEILKITGTPRGSIYHHFPRGKDQLIEEAIDLLGLQAFEPLEHHAGAPAEEIAQEFLKLWRAYAGGSTLQAGCAILAVTVTADSPRLVARAAAVFRTWRERLAVLLERGGLQHKDAISFAATLIAAVEGATVLSRAERTIDQFDLISNQLIDMAQRLARGRSPRKKIRPS
jgi:TetR/AcrR family transcriptional repressor of lmrAB and yxaGH operons